MIYRRKKEEVVRRCPRCNAPRLENAWDCVECGLVFEDAPPPPERVFDHGTQRLPSVRQTGSARLHARGEPGPALKALRGFVDDNLVGCVVVVLLAYLGVATLFAHTVGGLSTDPEALRLRFREVMDRPLPDRFEPGQEVYFMGRHLDTFAVPDSSCQMALYWEDALAGESSPEKIHETAVMLVRELQVPLEVVGLRTAQVGDRRFPVEVVRLGREPAPHLWLAVFSGEDGRGTLVAIVGEPVSARQAASEVFDAR